MADPKKVHYNDLESIAGQEVGVSDWVTIDQERVNKFADATGDHQWIHVDPERIAADGSVLLDLDEGALTALAATLRAWV
ncbi:MaoC/PaaZ C-terminal domain-containing protein, partial [Henriciella sp.]|uniref:MaoC/PaaZ C-terminal domain-containing protein n=1 Tax=Henriciella sp. TaxID=1968823 RepID=UPI0017E77D46